MLSLNEPATNPQSGQSPDCESGFYPTLACPDLSLLVAPHVSCDRVQSHCIGGLRRRRTYRLRSIPAVIA